MLDHFCDSAVDDAALSSAQGVDDADALLDLDRDGLLGDPTVGVLEDSEGGLGVAGPGGVEQMLAIFALTVSPPLLFGQFGHLVKLFQSPVLDGQHSCRQRQRVILQPQIGSFKIGRAHV